MFTVEERIGSYVKGQYVSSGKFYLRKFEGSGTASVIESDNTWNSEAEAKAAADRANSGDETGLRFSCFADD